MQKSPSHNTKGNYVILMETNGKEYESWYYFIQYENNVEALRNLQYQLNQIDWYILDDLSTFDLDLEHLVSAKTAKELTKVELNSQFFHRKFDGKLKHINLKLKSKDNNDKKICKVFDKLGYGQIEEYVSDEDIDEEDLIYDTETEDTTETDSETEEENDKELVEVLPSIQN